jgi:hypothetical protein
MKNSVWDKLSQIDCNAHTEKKGQFTYLSWTWAVAMIKEHYPNMTHQPLEDVVYADGSMEVRCEVTIEDQTHPMWLPVTDFKNKAIQNPNAFDINTARMRVLTKNFAVNYGLGHYIYAGESYPQPPAVQTHTDEDLAEFKRLLAAKDGAGFIVFFNAIGEDARDSLFNSAPQGEKTKLKDACRKVVQLANSNRKTAVAAIEQAILDNSITAIDEVLEECNVNEAALIQAALTEIQLIQILNLREEQ